MTLRVAVTLLSFVTFLGIVAWALARRNQRGFDEAAQLPFVDEAAHRAARHCAVERSRAMSDFTSPGWSIAIAAADHPRPARLPVAAAGRQPPHQDGR